MTSGERMVWAGAFNHALAHGHSAARACEVAANAVAELHTIRSDQVTENERAMLDDMLGAGGDRKPAPGTFLAHAKPEHG